MQRVMIVGAGKGGMAILDIFKQTADVVAVVDINPDAPGIIAAQKAGIQTGSDWHKYISDQLDIIIEVTGEDDVFKELRDARGKNTVLIPGSVAFLLATLLEEKEELIKTLRKITYEHDLIFKSSGDGMVVLNTEGIVTLFNK
ncbi:MAG: sigma-54-dependent Fis family transcriptional regulator, partial [Mesobacillus sp.]